MGRYDIGSKSERFEKKWRALGVKTSRKASKPIISGKDINDLNKGFWGVVWGIICLFFSVIWLIVSAPFKLMGKLYKSRAPILVKIILTGVFLFFLLIVIAYVASFGTRSPQ